MSFGVDSPILDDAESWEEASRAYQTGLPYARDWQSDARTALVELGEYPPAHLNAQGQWEILYWSPGTVKGLRLILDQQLNLVSQAKWGAFYLETARQLGDEILGPQRFSFRPEISQPGPDGLSFVFRRPSSDGNTDDDTTNEFIDIQISTSVMLTPPPRRFTINLVKNAGERPMFGAFGGWEGRLGEFLPTSQPDRWWLFQDEAEYAAQLREALSATVTYGLPALASH